ncbi:MAG: M55 family metallopeptidase [Gemmatimonadaceae bacterium]
MRRSIIPASSVALFGLLTACAPEQPQRAASSEPWALEDVRPDSSNGFRILVLHDMEGLSGQSNPRTFSFGMPEYAQGQELLVADINAVIEGLYAGGATEVHVVDGHGSGNPAPDVRRDLLDSRAQQVLRDSAFDSYFDLVAPGAYDAVAVVGMHAKTGSGGFASHTYTLGIGFIINNKSITETELVGLSWGRQGIPVIFASGDDRLARDLESMPWIEYVTVKRATAADSAEPRPVAEARADLRQAAERAMRKLRGGGAKAMRVTTPITTSLHAVPPADIALLDSVPGITYADQRVTFVAQDMHEAYRGLVKLVRIATGAYPRLLTEELRSRPQGEEILNAYSQRLARRWFDVESGRWTPPAPRQASATGAKFHGFR